MTIKSPSLHSWLVANKDHIIRESRPLLRKAQRDAEVGLVVTIGFIMLHWLFWKHQNEHPTAYAGLLCVFGSKLLTATLICLFASGLLALFKFPSDPVRAKIYLAIAAFFVCQGTALLRYPGPGNAPNYTGLFGFIEIAVFGIGGFIVYLRQSSTRTPNAYPNGVRG